MPKSSSTITNPEQYAASRSLLEHIRVHFNLFDCMINLSSIIVSLQGITILNVFADTSNTCLHHALNKAILWTSIKILIFHQQIQIFQTQLRCLMKEFLSHQERSQLIKSLVLWNAALASAAKYLMLEWIFSFSTEYHISTIISRTHIIYVYIGDLSQAPVIG